MACVHQITDMIDWGNSELKLDLIPRNAQGEVLDTSSATIIDLYNVHEEVCCFACSEHLRNSLASNSRKRSCRNKIFACPFSQSARQRARASTMLTGRRTTRGARMLSRQKPFDAHFNPSHKLKRILTLYFFIFLPPHSDPFAAQWWRAGQPQASLPQAHYRQSRVSFLSTLPAPARRSLTSKNSSHLPPLCFFHSQCQHRV